MKNVTPFLWYKEDARKVAKFYASVFKGSKIIDADAMSARVVVGGQELILFNGGPHFKFTPAFSLSISCKTQKEVDYFWKKLSKGGKLSHCGWLEDKYGLSWQVIPEILPDLLGHKDRVKAGRAMQAMLKMGKLDIAKLRKAFNGA